MPKRRIKVRVDYKVTTKLSARLRPPARPIGYHPAFESSDEGAVYCPECGVWTPLPAASLSEILCDGACNRMLPVASF